MKKVKMIFKGAVATMAFVALLLFINAPNVEAQQGMKHHHKPQGKCRGSAANCVVWQVIQQR